MEIVEKGHNKNSEYTVVDKRTGKTVNVDSLEEVEMYEWLDYALEKGVIEDFTYQPKTFELSQPISYTNSKGKSKSRFREHVYSPDFRFTVSKENDWLLDELKYDFGTDGNREVWIDVKGTFNRNARSFSIDQKWVLWKYGIYIHKLIPKIFFKKCGIIDSFKTTRKTNKPSKKYEGYPDFDDVFSIKYS